MWLQRNVVDQDGFVALAGPLGSNKEFQEGLSTMVAAQTAASLNLPPQLKELAAAVITSTARSLYTDPGYAQAWTDTLGRSHALSFAAAGNKEIQGDLQLDIAPLVAMVASRVGKDMGVTFPHPKDVVVSLEQPQAARLLPMATTLGGWWGWLALIAAGLLVLGVLVARRRSLAVILAGAGLALVALVWLAGFRTCGIVLANLAVGPEAASQMGAQLALLAQDSWQGGITATFIFAAVVAAAGGTSLIPGAAGAPRKMVAMSTTAVSVPMPAVPRRRRSPEEVAAAAPVTAPKRVLLAAPRGYCAGVDRAVIAVEKALEHYGAPVYVRKQIVHNVHVVSSLEARGAIFVEENEEVPEGELVVFSAHGVSPAVVQSAEDRGLRTIDATCPLVTKVHKEAVRFAKENNHILLIGHEGHEEVEGTYGEAPESTTIVNNPEEARTVQVDDPDHLIWLSQTTLSVDETMEIVDILRERFPKLQNPPSDDICYATTNRQVAIKKIAPQAELVIVVGSANSSNSVRLVEVALEYGAKASYRVDFANEIDETWFEGVASVGVTSGASVPEILVQDVLRLLAEYGYGSVEEVVTAEEDILFSLPKELRATMKAAGDPTYKMGAKSNS